MSKKLSKGQQSDIKKHLMSILHKFSDADSNILSDYIVALLAKDGDESQIRKDCESELSAFMNDKTHQFVNELFQFIKKQQQQQRTNDTNDIVRSQIKHKRKVQVQSKSKSTSNNIIITRDSNDINNNDDNNNSSSKPQISSVIMETNNNDEQQHDFIVSTTPTPPHSATHSAAHDPDNKMNHLPNSPLSKYNGNHSHHPQPPHHHHRRRRRKQHDDHNNMDNKNNNSLQTLTQILGLVQQNIQSTQPQQYQNPNKAFMTRRTIQNSRLNTLNSLNSLNALNSINPTLLASYVARPIIQHTPTPNIIQNTQTKTKQQQQQRQETSSKSSKSSKQDTNILDKSLDELRLPPNNNPFYQDDRFNSINKQNKHYHHKNKHVGKKRNFSKMNDKMNDKMTDIESKHNGKKNKKFQTEFSEKRQLYVYNIPSHLNTMTRLTSHFQQFGDIQHIQVHRDLNKAYVQFSNHNEALEALNYPHDILGDKSIQTVWAHYNRRDFDRNAKAKVVHDADHNHNHNHNHNDHDDKPSKSKSKSPSKPINHQWISQEYKQKIVDTAPPKKKQKLSNGNNVHRNDFHKSNDKTDKIEKHENIAIPKDVSENIDKLKKRLTETLKMYEVLEESESDNKDSIELKNTLKKTIETIEIQMKKLMVHQKKRQEMIHQNKTKSKQKQKQKLKPRGGGGSGYRGRYRGGYSGRGRRGYHGGGYPIMYNNNPMMMMMMNRGNGMYWRGGKIRNKYRSIIRKSKHIKHNKKLNKVDLSGKTTDYRTTSLMIQSLPTDIDESGLRVHFLKFGQVQSIDLFSNGFAKVQFKKRCDAEKALLNGKQFKASNNKIFDIKLRFVDDDDDDDVNHIVVVDKGNNNNNNNHNHDELKVYDDLPQNKEIVVALKN